MKTINFIAAGLAGLTLAILSPSTAKAAAVAGACAMTGDTDVISVAHRHWRRPVARLACADISPDWPYYFHEFYCPDGRPLPIGFYGGKAFYYGGVW
jgi:hypothetical protein